jgi:hypothetical protein
LEHLQNFRPALVPPRIGVSNALAVFENQRIGQGADVGFRGIVIGPTVPKTVPGAKARRRIAIGAADLEIMERECNRDGKKKSLSWMRVGENRRFKRKEVKGQRRNQKEDLTEANQGNEERSLVKA